MPYVPQLFNQASPGVFGLTATAASRTLACSDSGRTILIIDLEDGGSYVPGTATITVKARLQGAGNTDGTSTWGVTNLSYVNRATYTNANIAGTTAYVAAVPAALEYDITGLECQIVYTIGTATGTLNIRAKLLTVSP